MQAMVSQEARLEAALQSLRGKNANISQEAGEIRVLSHLYMLSKEQLERNTSFSSY